MISFSWMNCIRTHKQKQLDLYNLHVPISTHTQTHARTHIIITYLRLKHLPKTIKTRYAGIHPQADKYLPNLKLSMLWHSHISSMIRRQTSVPWKNEPAPFDFKWNFLGKMAIFWHFWPKSAKVRIFIKNRAMLFCTLIVPQIHAEFQKIIGGFPRSIRY